MGNKVKGTKSEVVDNQEAVINHPKINNVTIRRTNKDHEYMETNMPIVDKKDYDEWVKALKHSPGQKSQYALHPRKHDLKKDKTCGKSGMAKIQYDNYSYTLKDQIKNRQKPTQHGPNKFQETQLWYLLHSLADVADSFHDKNQKVGDIRPENIFVNDNGQIKVSTLHSWPRENDNYEKYFYEHEPTLLAPQELNDIQVGRNASTADIKTAQSFSIGMTALDSAQLDNSERMYNKNSFDYDALNMKRRNLFNDPKYSDLFKIVVGNLTAPHPNRRMTAQELKDFLRPNQQKITRLQNFSVNDIPNKLKETVKKIQLPSRSSYQPQQVNYQRPVSSEYASFLPPQQSYTIERQSSNIPPTQIYESVTKVVQPQKPNYIEGEQTKYRMTLAEIQEKVAKSRAMHPS